MPWLALAALAIYFTLAGISYHATHLEHRPTAHTAETILLVIGLLLHGVATLIPFMPTGSPHFGAAEALSLTAWLALALYLVGRTIWQAQTPMTMPMVLAAALLLLSLLLPPSPPLDYALTPLARGHLLIAMLSYGMLTNAAATALLMQIADRRLHHTKTGLLQRSLPPLLVLERLLFLCLWSGFALLTLTLISGLAFAEQAWGHTLVFNHKSMFSLVAWLLFGTLLAGHIRRGWRGRLAAIWTLAGYALLLFGYMGAQLIMTLSGTHG